MWLQVLEGLSACHDTGIVHRDVKPQVRRQHLSTSQCSLPRSALQLCTTAAVSADVRQCCWTSPAQGANAHAPAHLSTSKPATACCCMLLPGSSLLIPQTASPMVVSLEACHQHEAPSLTHAVCRT